MRGIGFVPGLLPLRMNGWRSRRVKVQDELAALGLDRRCSQPNDYPISGQRKTSDSELAQPSITLEPTGFLMEGQVTH
jgi:hypothetical protein